jgi:hypothetical protein
MEQAQEDGALGQPHNDASKLSENVESSLQNATSKIKDQARTAAEQTKLTGAEHLEGMTRAVHGAADELGHELPQAAHYIHSAAEQLEKASSALRQRSVEDLAGDFSAFARRQPTVAFAGAVLAGFALSRFLKSSAEHRG